MEEMQYEVVDVPDEQMPMNPSYDSRGAPGYQSYNNVPMASAVVPMATATRY